MAGDCYPNIPSSSPPLVCQTQCCRPMCLLILRTTLPFFGGPARERSGVFSCFILLLLSLSPLHSTPPSTVDRAPFCPLSYSIAYSMTVPKNRQPHLTSTDPTPLPCLGHTQGQTTRWYTSRTSFQDRKPKACVSNDTVAVTSATNLPT